MKKKTHKKPADIPSSVQFEKELNRLKYRKRYLSTIRSTIFILITVAAAAVLISSMLLPIFRIYGTSMAPTLEEGDIVAAVKTTKFDQKDLIAFYYNNRILVKRVIANAGEWVDIDEDGNVYVNSVKLDEDEYVKDKSLGDCNIRLPYQVPEGKIFVMGDHRTVSMDSRNSLIGCVSEEQIAGKLIVKIWPFSSH